LFIKEAKHTGGIALELIRDEKVDNSQDLREFLHERLDKGACKPNHLFTNSRQLPLP